MNIGRKQLVFLFVSGLVLWVVGNGLMPLLPVRAVELGADASTAGLYLAVSYLALALGAVCAGLISSSRLKIKIPLVIIAMISIPVTWMLGRVETLLALTLLTALLWFTGGFGLATVSILAGMSAGKHERGRVFGILAITSGLGSAVGALFIGWLVETWGFSRMFTILAIYLLLAPLTMILLKEKRKDTKEDGRQAPSARRPLGRAYWLLFLSSIIASSAGFFIVLVRSLGMSGMGFSPLEISSTVIIGGLVSMPLPFILGWASDRLNRKYLLIIGYLCYSGGLILLGFSSVLWHFHVVLILHGIAVGCISSVGSAWVTDIIPVESLGKGLALFNTTTWIGGIAGFMAAGMLEERVGSLLTCIIGCCLGLVAVAILPPYRKPDGAGDKLA